MDNRWGWLAKPPGREPMRADLASLYVSMPVYKSSATMPSLSLLMRFGLSAIYKATCATVALVLLGFVCPAIAQTEPSVPASEPPTLNEPDMSPDAPNAQSSVTGRVLYLQRSALPPNAVLQVQLLDVTRANAPAIVLGEQRIHTNGRQVPIDFEVVYDPALVQDDHRYSLQARITVDNRLLFVSRQLYPVITMGNPVTVEIRVDPAGG